MSVQTFSAVPNIDTLANYKSWAKGISDALAAIGWVKSSDTGQIDLSTVGAVPTSGATGYEIWKMADALQTTHPIFLKLEYWNQSGTPTIGVTVGQGSDGAGTLTGNITSHFVVNFDANASPWPCAVCGDTSRVTILMFITAGPSDSGVPFGIQIERSHDATGADTGDYTTILMAGQGVNKQETIFDPAIGTNSSSETRWCSFCPQTATSGTLNSSTWFCPTFPFVGAMGNPMIAGTVKTADINDGATFSVKFYGTPHTLMGLKTGPFTGVGLGSGGCAAWRYE